MNIFSVFGNVALACGITCPILILIVSLFRRDLEKRRQDMITTIGFLVYVMFGIEVLSRLPKLHSNYDEYLLKADSFLGYNTREFADRLAHHWFAWIFLIAYVMLPYVMIFAWSIEQNPVMRRAVVIGGLFCLVCYALCPAVGPWHYDWQLHQVIGDAPDNCMPSMHFTWALLFAMNARRKWLRYSLWIYVAMIEVATVGLGEHYLVDLIVALPFAYIVQSLALKASISRVPQAVQPCINTASQTP